MDSFLPLILAIFQIPLPHYKTNCRNTFYRYNREFSVRLPYFWILLLQKPKDGGGDGNEKTSRRGKKEIDQAQRDRSCGAHPIGLSGQRQRCSGRPAAPAATQRPQRNGRRPAIASQYSIISYFRFIDECNKPKLIKRFFQHTLKPLR